MQIGEEDRHVTVMISTEKRRGRERRGGGNRWMNENVVGG
jgi:hypothetical protein